MFDKPTRFTTEQKVLLKTVEELRQIELEKSFSPTYGSTDSKVQH